MGNIYCNIYHKIIIFWNNYIFYPAIIVNKGMKEKNINT